MHLLHTIKTFAFRLLPFRKKKTGDFVRHRRYRLSLVNTNSLETRVSLRASKLGLWLFAIILFLAIGAIWLLIAIHTPLRNALPMRLQSDLRDDYADLALRADSAAERLAINERYTRNLLSILTDSLPQTQQPSDLQLDPLPLDSLVEASAAERSFVSRFEESERFNLSVLSPIAAEGMRFYPPVIGIETAESTTDAGIPYVGAVGGTATPVSAIYRGTVLNTYFTTGKGITVVIQHPNDFISEYSGLSEVFVSRGEKVQAGARIGLVSQKRYPLVFELWHNGSPLPPTQYIPFDNPQ